MEHSIKLLINNNEYKLLFNDICSFNILRDLYTDDEWKIGIEEFLMNEILESDIDYSQKEEIYKYVRGDISEKYKSTIKKLNFQIVILSVFTFVYQFIIFFILSCLDLSFNELFGRLLSFGISILETALLSYLLNGFINSNGFIHCAILPPKDTSIFSRISMYHYQDNSFINQIRSYSILGVFLLSNAISTIIFNLPIFIAISSVIVFSVFLVIIGYKSETKDNVVQINKWEFKRADEPYTFRAKCGKVGLG